MVWVPLILLVPNGLCPLRILSPAGAINALHIPTFRLPVKIFSRSRPRQRPADRRRSRYPVSVAFTLTVTFCWFGVCSFFPRQFCTHLQIVSSRLYFPSLFVLGNVMRDSVKSLHKSRYMTCTYSFLSAMYASLSEKGITIV